MKPGEASHLQPVDLLDGVINLLTATAIVSGWRRGLSWVSLSLLGLAAGVVIGALIASPVAHSIASSRPETEALIGIAVFLTAVALVQGVGTAIGYRVRLSALRTRLASFDPISGPSWRWPALLLGPGTSG
jgi:uncharacterized membrane protein required for colicin V production